MKVRPPIGLEVQASIMVTLRDGGPDPTPCMEPLRSFSPQLEEEKLPTPAACARRWHSLC